jgi:hypothetical protein
MEQGCSAAKEMAAARQRERQTGSAFSIRSRMRTRRASNYAAGFAEAEEFDRSTRSGQALNRLRARPKADTLPILANFSRVRPSGFMKNIRWDGLIFFLNRVSGFTVVPFFMRLHS